MQLNECLNFKLTYAQNTVFNYFKSTLAPFDVTPVQYAILKCLWEQDEQTPSQLARALHLDSSTITGLLGRMELKDFIERIHSSTDRRVVVIRIREAGIALKPGIENAIERANQEILEVFQPSEISVLTDLLARIVDRVYELDEEKSIAM